jgi:hypothetical protein
MSLGKPDASSAAYADTQWWVIWLVVGFVVCMGWLGSIVATGYDSLGPLCTPSAIGPLAGCWLVSMPSLLALSFRLHKRVWGGGGQKLVSHGLP